MTEEKSVLENNFESSVIIVNNLKQTPPDDELLEIYGLFKQSTVGNINTVRPGMLNFKGKSKWDAWDKHKGTSQDEAKQLYINKAMELFKLYNN